MSLFSFEVNSKHFNNILDKDDFIKKLPKLEISVDHTIFININKNGQNQTYLIYTEKQQNQNKNIFIN